MTPHQHYWFVDAAVTTLPDGRKVYGATCRDCPERREFPAFYDTGYSESDVVLPPQERVKRRHEPKMIHYPPNPHSSCHTSH